MRTAWLVVPVLALTACGGGGGVSKAGSSGSCADVAAGKPVVKAMVDNGCKEADGKLSLFLVKDCPSGKQVASSTDATLYGVIGETWKPTGEGPGFYESC